MLYSELKAALLPLVADGWPASVDADMTYDVVSSSSAGVSISVASLETALSTYLDGLSITALLDDVPTELTQIIDTFLSTIRVNALQVRTGPSQGGAIGLRSFLISLDPAHGEIPPLGGLTLDDFGLQLNFMPVGATLAWNPILYATAAFLGVTCGLQVGLIEPSITLGVSEGTSATIDTILDGAQSGTSLSSLAGSMGLTLSPSDVTLDLLLVQADLGTSPTFECVMQLSFTDVTWQCFTLAALGITFTHGGGDTTFGANVTASVGGFEVDAAIAHASAAGTTTLTGSCPAVGANLASFWNTLGCQIGVECPVPGLDDVDLSGLTLSIIGKTGSENQTSYEFDIHCGGNLTFDALGGPLWFDFGFTKEFDGSIKTTLTLGSVAFVLSKTETTMVFSCQGPVTLPLAELVTAMRLDALAGLANDLHLTLNGADLIIQTPSAPNTPNTPKNILFVADLSFDATVEDDILAMITGADTVGCTGATLFAANSAWTLDQLDAVTGRAVTVSHPLPKGVSATPVLTLGGAATPVPLAPPTTSNTASAPAPAPAPQGGVASTGGTWYKVQKQVGPVYLDQVGFGFGRGADAGTIAVMADAAFALGPLTVTLDGFEVDVRYPSPQKVSVRLRGLAVTYDKAPLLIQGGFLAAGDGTYLGDLTVKTETFLLSAIGEYAKKDEYTSLAVFAALTDPPLGGPVFCFVEGLAAGFGYNSRLNVPAKASEVAGFGLVQVATGELSPDDPFTVIEQCITPTQGEDWVAVGLKFRSFEMVESVVLLTAAFGDDLQFTILGQSEISLPPASPERIAYAQVDVLARYVPSTETLSVSGILTPKSYVLSPDCHIQGGFLYMLDGSGTFVISYGGYAPGFDYQSLGYPDVPRLQLSWTVDEHTGIVGQQYCAITPAAMMAGGSLHANWDSGIFSAWFDVTMDVFVQWRPFHYSADFAMSLGVSFDFDVAFISVHFTFHVGATLSIHGPPFGGHAHIDLDVVSFDIDLGADAAKAAPLDWTGFRAMLPGDPAEDLTDSALVSATVTGGLVKDGAARKAGGGSKAAAAGADGPDWIVDGSHFAFAIKTSLPITEASSGHVTVTQPPLAASVGVLPMGLVTASGRLDVVITDADGTVLSENGGRLSVEAVTIQGAPALWGRSSPTGTNTPSIPMTSGYIVTGNVVPSTETMGVDVADLLAERITVRALSDRAARANPFA